MQVGAIDMGRLQVGAIDMGRLQVGAIDMGRKRRHTYIHTQVQKNIGEEDVAIKNTQNLLCPMTKKARKIRNYFSKSLVYTCIYYIDIIIALFLVTRHS